MKRILYILRKVHEKKKAMGISNLQAILTIKKTYSNVGVNRWVHQLVNV